LFQINPGGAGYDDPGRRTVFYAQVQDSLSAIPGVKGATFLGYPLLANAGWSGAFFFPDRSSDYAEKMQSQRLAVGETFFETMGIPVLQGRKFTAADAKDAPRVIVVNEAFARQYSSDRSPLGRIVHILTDDWRIVGVCRDTKNLDVKAAAQPTVYYPFRQISYGVTMRNNFRSACFALRTTLPPLSLVTAARKAAAAIDSNVPLTNITTQEAVRDMNIRQERLLAALCAVLAGLVLLLCCIGLYGLMAYHTARRTPEFAIRMALGAAPRNVARPVLQEALMLAAAGLAAGVPAALVLTRFIKSQLYGVAPTDPVSLVGAGVLLVAIAVLAAWLPARRASKVDPTVALRNG
jgi:predicted permease